MTLQHRFVNFIPEQIEAGILYISLEYSTVIHKCICGCGIEAVTPISPTSWQMKFDGKSISIYPSIENFPCKTHYWITNSMVVMVQKLEASQVKRSRKRT